MDECSQNTDNCDTNAICSNTPGSFVCQCEEGFSGDGISCSSKAIHFKWFIDHFRKFFTQVFIFKDNYLFILDINECLTNPCNLNARCTDNQGSFVCQCNAGYSGNGFVCSSKCKDQFNLFFPF